MGLRVWGGGGGGRRSRIYSESEPESPTPDSLYRLSIDSLLKSPASQIRSASICEDITSSNVVYRDTVFLVETSDI